MQVPRLWVQGENIPDDHIGDIFQLPPGLTLPILRSALITGTKGAGKSTLFRYLKRVHNGVALHISLSTEFGSLTKQTGTGPLAPSSQYSPTSEALIGGKAVSLLALSLVHRLSSKGLSPDLEFLRPCVPPQLESLLSNIDDSSLSSVRKELATAPLDVFRGILETRPLPALISGLAEDCERRFGPLLLLLDRADQVLIPSLTPVFELLDQSAQYVALVAMRPTHVGFPMAGVECAAVAGDHYDVVHIGTHPWSEAWRTFVESCVSAQMEVTGQRPLFSEVPPERRTLIANFARDSLRTALQLYARFFPTPAFATNRLLDALDDLRENHLTAAQTTLQAYHPDFRRMLRALRNEAAGEKTRVEGPLIVSIRERSPDTLFEVPTLLDPLIGAALRSGAFCMPQGHRWSPSLRVREVEIPPLLVWEKADGLPRFESSKPVRITIKENVVLQRPGGPRKPPSIFVAYRVKSTESQKFRAELAAAMHSHPFLSQLKIHIVDGRVAAGGYWADEIRKRIRQARLVVGDVNGVKPDVVFELGFAYGLGKPIVPAVPEGTAPSELPSWLTAIQLGHYGTSKGIRELVSDVVSHLAEPQAPRVPRPPQPNPAVIVWLGQYGWNHHTIEQFEAAVRSQGLRPEILSPRPTDEGLIRRAASATLLVAALDGTETDAFMHFVSGAVVAVPKAGYGTLPRRILVVVEPSQDPSDLVADSLRRCHATARVLQPSEVRTEVNSFLQHYQEWSKRPQQSPRRRK